MGRRRRRPLHVSCLPLLRRQWATSEKLVAPGPGLPVGGGGGRETSERAGASIKSPDVSASVHCIVHRPTVPVHRCAQIRATEAGSTSNDRNSLGGGSSTSTADPDIQVVLHSHRVMFKHAATLTAMMAATCAVLVAVQAEDGAGDRLGWTEVIECYEKPRAAIGCLESRMGRAALSLRDSAVGLARSDPDVAPEDAAAVGDLVQQIGEFITYGVSSYFRGEAADHSAVATGDSPLNVPADSDEGELSLIAFTLFVPSPPRPIPCRLLKPGSGNATRLRTPATTRSERVHVRAPSSTGRPKSPDPRPTYGHRPAVHSFLRALDRLLSRSIRVRGIYAHSLVASL